MKIGLLISTFIILQLNLAQACMPKPIVLNDDTHLYPSGIYAPISDPQSQNAVKIEDQWKLFNECAAAQLMNCTQHIQFEVADSAGLVTHRLRMNLDDSDPQMLKALYIVMDLSNDQITHYEGFLGTRSCDGLKKVKNYL